MMGIAFKVFTTEQWAAFVADGEFAGALVDFADGYIHMSSAEQLDETIARHFAGKAVHVARIELSSYGDAVRWEPSRGGALFPHIYGEPLRMDTVIDHQHRVAAA